MTQTAVTPLQEEFLSTITTFEDATVKVAKSWAKMLSTTPTNGELFQTPKVETMYGFFEKLWGVQRDFIVNLLEIATEAGKTVPDQVKRNAERVAGTEARAAGVK
jgi:hypothetical protein